MSVFDINVTGFKKMEGIFDGIGSELEMCSGEIQSVSAALGDVLSNADIVGQSLGKLSGQIDRQADAFRSFGKTATSIALLYTSTDDEIAGKGFGKNSGTSGSEQGCEGNTADGGLPSNAEGGSVLEREKDGWRFSGRKAEGSVFGGSASADGGILGGSASYGFLNWKAETKAGIQVKYKNGRMNEASIGASGEIGGSLAKGSAEGHIGFVKGKVSGEIGKVSAKGEVGASLYKDGKLSPSITAKAEAKAKGATGEVSYQIGSDDYNYNMKASGTLGNASASISGGAGVITYKDENTGALKSELGVTGKVGAEAYVAEGTVSGGFTIMGIKIKASVTGKAGGAGIGAEGRATTGGVSGEIKAGLGIGAGLKIDVDWSDFKPKWPWQK